MNDEHIKEIARAAALEIIAIVERIGRERDRAGTAMTVADFSRAVNRHPEVVRRAIRAQIIPRACVSKRPPYLLQPEALKIYGVTPEQAALRLRLAPPAAARRTSRA